MARDLKADQETLQAVLGYAQNRDIARAAALAERTLASGFEHPLLLNVVATRLEHEGKFEDALRLLEKAVAMSPQDIPARNALALCLQRLDRPAEALYHLDELLRLDPNLGYAHASRGNALIAMGSLGQAQLSHQRALELQPGNLAATVALASIASSRGRHDEARRWAERALQIAPGLPDAVVSLAAAELAGGEYTQAEALLQKLILDSRAGALDRARATGLLGDVLDAQGRYAEAFAAYQTCNEALRQVHQRYASGTSVLAYTNALRAAVGKVDPQLWASHPAPAAGPDRGHAFLIGFPRSGTTLLEVVLDGHPQVASIEEHELLTAGVLRFMRDPIDLEPLLRAPERDLHPLRAAYWDAVGKAGIDVTGKVFLDKHPLNTLKLPLIARLFPHAKILFACRDPRDVVLSCFRRRFRMNPAMYELLTLPGAAAFYDAVMQLAGQVQPLAGLDWHAVRYESLVADLAAETRTICRFLGLEWVAGMDDFASRAQTREHATPSTAQLVGGLNQSGIGLWRNYPAPLQAILPTLAPWVEELRYPG